MTTTTRTRTGSRTKTVQVTATPQGSPDSPEMRWVAPAELVTDSNVRRELRLDAGFVESIATQGVLVPIVATVNPAGELAIRYGHRRAAAAVQAGLVSVPVLVMPEGQTATGLILGQLAENVSRAGLTGAEEQQAHDQLALLGVPLAEAAKATGTKPERVKGLRALAEHPTARDTLDQLDLAGALLVAEFDHDPQFVAELIAAGRDEGTHEMARLAQRRRDEDELTTAITAQQRAFEDLGYQIVADGSYHDRRYTQMWELRGPDGQRLTPELHENCPARAVRVWGWSLDRIRVEHLCTDPKAGGHTLTTQTPPNRDDAAAAAERAKVIANNKQWRAAETVRRTHVRNWLAGAKPTAALTGWMLNQLLDGLETPSWKLSEELAKLGWANDVLREQDGRTVAAGTATTPRATIATLALVLADRELTAGVHSWRNVHRQTAEYLTFLETHTGYTLGTVEKQATGRTPDQAQ